MKKFFTVIFLGLISLGMQAQDNINEWVDGKKLWVGCVEKPKPKIYKLDLRDDGGGILPYYPALKIKKLALISFYVADEEFTTNRRKSVYSYNVGNYRVTETQRKSDVYSTDAGFVRKLTQSMYDIYVTSAKEELKKNGLELLELNELFAQNPDAEQIYKNFNPDVSGIGKSLADFGSFLTESASDYKEGNIASVDGYRIFPTDYFDDYKCKQSFGVLAKQLGVDAVVVSLVTITNEKGKSVSVKSAGSFVFGPNPVAKQDKKYVGLAGAGYNEGFLYWGIQFKHPDGVPFLKMKKGEITSFSLDGFDRLIDLSLNASLGKIWESSQMKK
jgi:hypothetical protein